MLDDTTQTALVTVLKRAQQLGFIGKKADLDSEIGHSLKFGELAFEKLLQPDNPTGLACLDLGSGGGLPALVVALVWRDTSWSLSEISDKRCDFLEWAIRHLGLKSKVGVLRGDVGKLPQRPEHRETYSLVTARAFAPVHTTQAAVVDLLKPGGFLLLSNPPKGRSREELAGSSKLIPYPVGGSANGIASGTGRAAASGTISASSASEPINISVFQKTL